MIWCSIMMDWYRGAMRGLIHRGGLRADIITGGTIRTGDAIVAVESERS